MKVAIDFKKEVLPHILALGIFFLITFLFYQPVFLENKTLQQNDVVQGEASAQEIKEYRNEQEEEVLWTNRMFGGMPAYLINIRYGGQSIIEALRSTYSAFLPRLPEMTFICFISFYILLLAYQVNPYLAIAGAVGFGFSTFWIISIEAGHNWKVDAIAYMPLVLAGIHLCLRNKLVVGGILTAVAMTFEIDAKHPQITYYLLLAVLFYGASELIFRIREGTLPLLLKQLGVLALAVLLGVGTNLGRLLNTYEYTSYSQRGQAILEKENATSGEKGGLSKEYVFNWSISPGETFTLLIPGLYGGGSTEDIGMDSKLASVLINQNAPRQQVRELTRSARTYWGPKPFTSGPSYVGAIIFFLAVLGGFLAPRRHRYWLIAASIFSAILAWGNNFEAFNYLMYDYFPGYNKFRTVEMSLVIALMCLPLLGFIGLQELLNNGLNKQTQKKLFLAAGIVGGICLLIAIFPNLLSFRGANDQALPQWYRDAIVKDRLSLARNDAIRSLVFIVAVLAVIYFYLKKKFNPVFLYAGLLILISVDMWTVNRRYLSNEEFQRERRQQLVAETEADRFIKEDKGLHERVLNLQVNPFQDARTSYHHASVGGYHAAKLRRYQDVIDRHLQAEVGSLRESIQNRQLNLSDYPVLNMLNTRYIMAGPQRKQVLKNPRALGNAWLVSNVEQVSSSNEEIDALNAIDPETTAVVHTGDFPEVKGNYNNQGSIKLTDYKPNELTYAADVSGEALAVFSEIYYEDGWKVTIDGDPASYLRVNYFLRGVKLPAGEHTVVFTFKPQTYYAGSQVMLVSSILVLVILIGGLAYELRRKLIA
jgi:hypothetical protein